MTRALAQALQGRLQTQGLRARDLAACPGLYPSKLSRLLSGDTPDPLLGTFLDLCAALACDPTTLLEMAGLWPQRGLPATMQDHALLEARRRIEAWPWAQKRWALRVVQALAAGARATAADDAGEVPHFCGDD